MLAAAAAVMAGSAAFFIQPSSPDSGALPLTGSEVVLRVSVMAGVFLAAWLTVMFSPLFRHPAADV